jgi:hypothetical protein
VNPERIFREYRDDALAKQITAKEYSTFVAMPFQERFSYPSRDIFEKVVLAAIKHANNLNKASRSFAVAKRADDEPGNARVITDDIVSRILECHIFLADLTFQNAGVLLEVGIALGLKPNSQIILITQDSLGSLHFDIRNNNVIQYNHPDAVNRIAEALVSAVTLFEANTREYIKTLSRSLTSDAILCLNLYGKLRRDNPGGIMSLYDGFFDHYFKGEGALNRFQNATRELLLKRLIWTDYAVGAIPGGDAYGMHATDLGWVFIETMWDDLKRTS